MTEPAAGSDLRGLRTTAQLAISGEGDHYVVNGSKIFIANEIMKEPIGRSL